MVPNLLGGSTMHKKNAKLLTLFVQYCSEKSEYFALLPLVSPQNDI